MTDRIRFADIPGRLHPLLTPPGKILETSNLYFNIIFKLFLILFLDPIAIHHRISCDPNESTRNKTTCYDIEVEIDDPLKSLQNKFLLDTANQVHSPPAYNCDYKLYSITVYLG